MMVMEKKETPLHPKIVGKTLVPAKSLNTNFRMRELQKINEENRVKRFCFLTTNSVGVIYLVAGIVEEAAVCEFAV
jgi:hypothetical protein